MNVFVIIIFAFIGFFTARFFSGKKPGEDGRIKSFKIRIGKFVIHSHHWLIAVIILILLLSINFYNDIIYGYLFGLVVQGLIYKDFYKVVYKDKKDLKYFINKIKKIIK